MAAVVKNPEFEEKHHRGTHGRFGPGMSRPKLLKRDERAIASIGQTFSPQRIGSHGHAAQYTSGIGRRIRPETAVAFHDLARALRRGDTSDERIGRLDAAMTPTEHDLVLTRHVPASAFGLKDDSLPHLREMLAGRKIVDRAYTPAALHQEPQRGGITMHIAVPKGTRALVADNNEMWLDRDLEFAVHDVYANGHGGYDVHVTALPKAGPAKKAAKKATKAPAKKATKAADVAKALPGTPPAGSTPAKRPEAARGGRATAPAPAAAKATKAAKKAAPTKNATQPKTVASPTTGALPSRQAPKLSDLMANGDHEYVDQEVRKAIDGSYGGLKVKVAAVGRGGGRGGGGIGVEGFIYGANGDSVGEFQRYFKQDEDGKFVASHEFLQLAPHVQGSGFAREFNANLIDWYRRSGFDRVKVHANIDVGGYTWATQGFDFENNEALSDWLNGARGRLNRWRAEIPPKLMEAFRDTPKAEVEAQLKELDLLLREVGNGRPTSAYEISQLGRKPGQGRHDMWAGKAIMLNSQWDGALRL